jgi:hypothetical protein
MCLRHGNKKPNAWKSVSGFKNGQAGGRKRESKRTKRIKRGRLSNAMFLFLTGRVVRELRAKDSFLQRKHN